MNIAERGVLERYGKEGESYAQCMARIRNEANKVEQIPPAGGSYSFVDFEPRRYQKPPIGETPGDRLITEIRTASRGRTFWGKNFEMRRLGSDPKMRVWLWPDGSPIEPDKAVLRALEARATKAAERILLEMMD